MKFLLVALLCVAASFALEEVEYQNAFIDWMHQYKVTYDHESFRARYQIFKNNLDFIINHNAKPENHRVGLNKFADLTAQEFAAIFNGVKMPSTLPQGTTFIAELGVSLPDSKDWRTDGAVTAVKNQGQCGSCWSFSTTGSVEGCHKLGTGTLVSLSEKNLMDCSWSQGNQGCNGGLMTAAMDYIISNAGVDTEASYPYVPESSQDCKYSKANLGSTLSTYSNVQQGDENALQQAVNKGPTSVAIDASHSSFQFYTSGVYYEPDCSSTALDHGVLAIGWGVSGSDYWLVKNSWGTDWGQQGYIWMSRNRDNNCGIATMATLPSGCSN
jgi:cathepsin L